MRTGMLVFAGALLLMASACEKKPIAKLDQVKGFWQDKAHAEQYLNVSEKAVIFVDGTTFTRYNVEKFEEQPGRVYFTTKAMTRKSGEKSFFVGFVPKEKGEIESHLGANIQQLKRVGDPKTSAAPKIMGSWRMKVPGLAPKDSPVIKVDWDQVTWTSKGKSDVEPLIVTKETADKIVVQSGKDEVELRLKGKTLQLQEIGKSEIITLEKI